MVEDLLPSLQLRPPSIEEQQLGQQLFIDSRWSQFSALPSAQARALLVQQYQLQQASYRQHYPTAIQLTIDWQQQAVGQLWLAWLPTSELPSRLHLIDLVIDPRWRQQGVATAVLYQLQQQATQAKVPLQLWVNQQNSPALRLYHKLGFVCIESTACDCLLSWSSFP